MLREVVEGLKYIKLKKERKEALTRSKTKYMLNKEWYCDVCKTGRNYTLAGKHCHLKTRKTSIKHTFIIL